METGFPLLLGVDAGGSKTVAILAKLGQDGRPAEIGRGAAGNGNPRAGGFASAFQAIETATTEAFLAAGQERQTVASACLAVAGADREQERDEYQRWAAGIQLSKRLLLVNDALPVLAAGTPSGWGIALIAGTGSLAYARDEAGTIARSGGWGYLFGDEGSGYAVALAGLRSAAKAADGRGPATELLSALLARLKLREPSQLIASVYERASDRSFLAGLAEVVLQCANGADAEAMRIVHAAADELSSMVSVLVRKLKMPPGRYPLAMAGGLLVNSPTLQELIRRELDGHAAPPGYLATVEEPVEGAVRLAADQLAAKN